MKITRNNLILAFLLFLLAINLFLIFDLQLFYIRAILAFIFIITIPGLLIMLMFKIRKVGFWEYLVYIIGLSIAFIMFAGLAVNWILPLLSITDKPLSLYPILICFDIFLLIFTFIAWRRNKDLEFKPKFPKFSWLDRIFLITPFCFPLMAVLGAFILNNFGPNYLTMIMLGSIAVYVFMLVLFRNKLNENVYPWALWLIGLSLLLSGSMRSWFLSGNDTNTEYQIFQIIKLNKFWTLKIFPNAYNAMLSINILPIIISHFTKISDHFIFKFILQIPYAFLMIIIFLLTFKFSCSKIISFLSVFLFISQKIFIEWSVIGIRQQIAFLFFGIMLIVLFTKELSPNIKKLFFLIFGFSMIVSHYTTSYIALAIFTLTYVFSLTYRKCEDRKIKKGKLKAEQKSQFYLTGVIVLLLLVFGFLWYSQVTNTSEGIISFSKRSLLNIDQIFSDEVQVKSQSIFEQLNPFHKTSPTFNMLNDYKNSYLNNTDTNSYATISYDIRFKYPTGIAIKINQNFNQILIFTNRIQDILIRLFISLGSLGLIFFITKKDSNKEYKILVFISILTLILLSLLPFASIKYDLSRAFQQFLIIFSFMVVVFPLSIFNYFKKNNKRNIIYIYIFFIIYFFFSAGLVTQLFGGYTPNMNLNNKGLEYNRYYSYNSEIISSIWLFSNLNSTDKINADGHANLRLRLNRQLNSQISITRDVLPDSIKKNSYVYLSNTNVMEEIAFKSYNRNLLTFNFPTEFLNDNKNKIYNNGGSEIFK